MKTSLLFSLTFLGAVTAHGASPNLGELMRTSPCRAQLKDALGIQLLKQTWIPAAISEETFPLQAGVTFRDTQSKKIYEAWSTPDVAHLTIQSMGATSLENLRWKSQSGCKLIKDSKKMIAVSLPNEVGFQNEDLFSLLNKNKFGLIYVWSPYMPLSIRGLQEVKSVAQTTGAELTILMDGSADKEAGLKWAKKEPLVNASLRKVASEELYSRNITLHYPVLLLYRDGFLSNRTYVGYKTADAYKKWIDFERAELGKDRK